MWFLSLRKYKSISDIYLKKKNDWFDLPTKSQSHIVHVPFFSFYFFVRGFKNNVRATSYCVIRASRGVVPSRSEKYTIWRQIGFSTIETDRLKNMDVTLNWENVWSTEYILRYCLSAEICVSFPRSTRKIDERGQIRAHFWKMIPSRVKWYSNDKRRLQLRAIVVHASSCLKT